jgi:hypothetical protein
MESDVMRLTEWLKPGLALVLALLFVAAATPSEAATGTVRITVTKAGFIVGVGGGSGVLVFKGRRYPIKAGGISAGTFGVASADLVGRAYNLRTAADIEGTYSAVGASVAVAGGGKVARIQNSRGVVLELSGKQIGFDLSINLGGLTVSLQ